jgi:hypothetical protein
MSQPIYQISVDLLLIARVVGALLWGILWAVFLQYHRVGQYLADKRTWVTVVVGVGVDLAIAYGADWMAVVFVFGASSLGIITRSLINESQRPKELGAYKQKWLLEDAMAFTDEVIILLRLILRQEPGSKVVSATSEALEVVQNLRLQLKSAREGRYLAKKSLEK